MAETPIDYLLSTVQWEPLLPPANDSDPLPYATHQGMLTIPGFGKLRVYQLNTGQRIINAEDLAAIFSEREEEEG